MSILIVRPGLLYKFSDLKSFFSKSIYEVYIPTPIKSAILAGYLGENFNCKILDLITSIPFKRENIMKRVASGYNFIVFTIHCFSEYPSALRFAKICKEINPEVKIIFHGSPATFMYKKSLSSGYVDYAIIGEGEEALKNLISEKKESSIRGIAYKKREKIIKTRQELPINLNKLPPPDFDKCKPIHFKYTNYLVESQRGCFMKCSFCLLSRFYSKVRFKDPKKFMDEIKNLQNLNLEIYDINFTNSKNHAIKICQEIKKRRFEFKSLLARTHVDFLNKSMLKTMKDAGFTDIHIGVESLTPNVLNAINKTKNSTIYAKKAVDLIKYASGLGLNVGVNYILMLPNQNKETVAKEIKKLKKYCQIYFFILTPFPGTPEWERLKDRLITKDFTLFDTHHLVFKSKVPWKDYANLTRMIYPMSLGVKNTMNLITLLNI